MDLLDIRRRDVWTVHGWHHLSEPRKVQLFLSFVNFRATSLLHLFKFPLTVVLYKTLFPVLDICFEQNILVWVATVIRCECSLNQFSTPLSVSLFVHREPQQIFMGVDTEHRANLVKARVNVPITLPHICWVCQYKLFLISEGWERFTEPLKPSLEYHWNDNQ